jgi:hypothetical protein
MYYTFKEATEGDYPNTWPKAVTYFGLWNEILIYQRTTLKTQEFWAEGISLPNPEDVGSNWVHVRCWNSL